MGQRSVWARFGGSEFRVLFAALSVASVGVVAACESSSDSKPGDIGSPGTVDGGLQNPVGGGDSGVVVGPDSGGPDTTPTIRDRFRHQWPVTADQPATSSYVVDANAGIVTDTVTGLQWTRDL